MLLILNLGIILTLLIIILFNINNTKYQIITTLVILSGLLLFKLIFDKMIVKNKKNYEVENNFDMRTELLNENINEVNEVNGVNKVNEVNDLNNSTNKFDLNNLDYIVNEMKHISNSYNEKHEKNIDRVNVKNNNYIFSQHSGNKDYHYSDLHNNIFDERKNVSNENSLLLDNVDCSNDNSCIIKPSIYNFHKV